MSRIGLFERASHRVSEAAGSTGAFAIAFGVVLTWGISGPLFGFSDTWQLVINTGTTIVTFLMVFLIQRAQNKDAKATALKLNELIAAMKGASNHLVNAEDLGEKELDTLHRHYARLAKLARRDRSVTESHSIDEAESRHRDKHAHLDAEDAPSERKARQRTELGPRDRRGAREVA